MSLAGPSTTPASTGERAPSASQSGNGASSIATTPDGSCATSSPRAVARLDFDRGVDERRRQLARRGFGELSVEMGERPVDFDDGDGPPPGCAHVIGGGDAGTRRVRHVVLATQDEHVDSRRTHRGLQLGEAIATHAA